MIQWVSHDFVGIYFSSSSWKFYWKFQVTRFGKFCVVVLSGSMQSLYKVRPNHFTHAYFAKFVCVVFLQKSTNCTLLMCWMPHWSRTSTVELFGARSLRVPYVIEKCVLVEKLGEMTRNYFLQTLSFSFFHDAISCFFACINGIFPNDRAESYFLLNPSFMSINLWQKLQVRRRRKASLLILNSLNALMG